MKRWTLSAGDEVHFYKKSLVVCFAGPRKVLSTGPNNGGYRENLRAVFNNDGNPGPGMACVMKADTYEEHMNLVASEDLGLDPATCTGMYTAASMENAAIVTLTYEDFTVTAIVTGGIQKNAGRIGDPAIWHEKAGISHQVPPGTINIILYIDADLPEGTLTRALVSCTEAKVAAIQELLAPSRFSHGLATGSGTDSTIVICNPQSPTLLTNAGKHSKLGEYIGRAVKAGVKEALERQSGLNPAYQHDVLHRMDRFGVTEDSLWQAYQGRTTGKARTADNARTAENAGIAETVRTAGNAGDQNYISRAEFTDRLDRLKTDSTLVTYTSLYAHLLDQLDWGLLSPEEAWEAGMQMLKLGGLSRQLDSADGAASVNVKGNSSVDAFVWNNPEKCLERMSREYLERLERRITR